MASPFGEVEHPAVHPPTRLNQLNDLIRDSIDSEHEVDIKGVSGMGTSKFASGEENVGNRNFDTGKENVDNRNDLNRMKSSDDDKNNLGDNKKNNPYRATSNELTKAHTSGDLRSNINQANNDRNRANSGIGIDRGRSNPMLIGSPSFFFAGSTLAYSPSSEFSATKRSIPGNYLLRRTADIPMPRIEQAGGSYIHAHDDSPGLSPTSPNYSPNEDDVGGYFWSPSKSPSKDNPSKDEPRTADTVRDTPRGNGRITTQSDSESPKVVSGDINSTNATALQQLNERNREDFSERYSPMASKYLEPTDRASADYNSSSADYNRSSADYNRSSADYNRSDADYNRSSVDYNRSSAEPQSIDGTAYPARNSNDSAYPARSTDGYYNRTSAEPRSTDGYYYHNRTSAESVGYRTSADRTPQARHSQTSIGGSEEAWGQRRVSLNDEIKRADHRLLQSDHVMWLTGDEIFGSTIQDYYNLENVIGEGSFGKVYVASHVSVEGSLAVKEIKKTKVQPSLLKRFENNVLELALKAEHPHVQKYIQFLEDPFFIYVVMELYTGIDFYQYIFEYAPIFSDPHLISFYAYQILGALSYIHILGAIHRDIKPDNFVFYDNKLRQLKMIDFGCACKNTMTLDVEQKSPLLVVDEGGNATISKKSSPNLSGGWSNDNLLNNISVRKIHPSPQIKPTMEKQLSSTKRLRNVSAVIASKEGDGGSEVVGPNLEGQNGKISAGARRTSTDARASGGNPHDSDNARSSGSSGDWRSSSGTARDSGNSGGDWRSSSGTGRDSRRRGSRSHRRLKNSKSITGSIGFCAPEIFEGVYDEKVDVYSFGILLSALVFFTWPYPNVSPMTCDTIEVYESRILHRDLMLKTAEEIACYLTLGGEKSGEKNGSPTRGEHPEGAKHQEGTALQDGFKNTKDTTFQDEGMSSSARSASLQRPRNASFVIPEDAELNLCEDTAFLHSHHSEQEWKSGTQKLLERINTGLGNFMNKAHSATSSQKNSHMDGNATDTILQAKTESSGSPTNRASSPMSSPLARASTISTDSTHQTVQTLGSQKGMISLDGSRRSSKTRTPIGTEPVQEEMNLLFTDELLQVNERERVDLVHDLISRCVVRDPKKRLSARQCMEHPFIRLYKMQVEHSKHAVLNRDIGGISIGTTPTASFDEKAGSNLDSLTLRTTNPFEDFLDENASLQPRTDKAAGAAHEEMVVCNSESMRSIRFEESASISKMNTNSEDVDIWGNVSKQATANTEIGVSKMPTEADPFGSTADPWGSGAAAADPWGSGFGGVVTATNTKDFQWSGFG